MPTGKITFPGGVSGQAIVSPTIPGSPAGVRGASFNAGGGVNAVTPAPNQPIDYGTGLNHFYAGFVPEIAKANYINPSNQGNNAEEQFAAAKFTGSNTPARSQFSEGYTAPIQVFASSNTWQLAGPVDSPGSRAKQPSTKFVSPFSTMPIPVKMPWDL